MHDQDDINDNDTVISQPKNTFPTTLADLRQSSPSSNDPAGFASQETIYKTLSRLRKSTLSIPNRLRSVLTDAHLIESLFGCLNRLCPLDLNSSTPTGEFTYTCDDSGDDYFKNGKAKRLWALIPNERSGSWPLDPRLKLRSQRAYLSSTLTVQPIISASTQRDFPIPTCQSQSQPVSAYLKSTDGHINQWAFSLRRLNLPVLTLLGHNYGAVLIDTTRRGKTYPDALRRTVPIFTCVWNHVLFSHLISTGICGFQSCNLDASEIAQIEARIPTFVSDLKGLGLDFEKIRNQTKRPIRCVWVSAPASGDDQLKRATYSLAVAINQERRKWKDVKDVDGVSILVCCSASRRVAGAEMSEDGYIQGSGDDSEGWSHGLTAKLFWDNKDELMTAVDSGEEMEELVKNLVLQSAMAGSASSITLIKPTINLFLGTTTNDGHRTTPSEFELIINCDGAAGQEPDTKMVSLGCKSGKLGSKMLRDKLAGVKQGAEALFQQNSNAKIFVTCSTGKDLSVGVVLMLLCTFYSENGKSSCVIFQSTTNMFPGSVELNPSQNQIIDKQFVKQRLAWVSTMKPDTNPSRATLQAVNSFLMERPT